MVRERAYNRRFHRVRRVSERTKQDAAYLEQQFAANCSVPASVAVAVQLCNIVAQRNTSRGACWTSSRRRLGLEMSGDSMDVRMVLFVRVRCLRQFRATAQSPPCWLLLTCNLGSLSKLNASVCECWLARGLSDQLRPDCCCDRK
jgi:hypothetical protein